jgi:hypothetical protein
LRFDRMIRLGAIILALVAVALAVGTLPRCVTLTLVPSNQ